MCRSALILPNGFEANFVMGFLRGLRANQLEVFVLSCSESTPALEASGIPHRNVRGRVSSERSALQKAKGLTRYYALTFLEVVRRRGSVIHFCGLFRNERILFEGLVLNLWLRLWAGRYLYTVHNVLPHSKEGSPWFRWVYRWIYRAPHRLIVHTATARRQLIEEFGVPARKIHLSSLGLNEEMPVVGVSLHEAREQFGLPLDARVILFFGKMDEYKGLDRLLEAFESLQTPGVRLVIAGTFRSEAYRKQVMGHLERMTRRDGITLEERYIPNEEAEGFFMAADVLCLPYRHIYQSGLVFLGPRFGLPLVTTDVGELREFVVGDHLGIVAQSNDAQGLRLALEEFFRRQDEFPRSTIRQRVRKYRWDRICASLVHLYEPPGNADPAAPAAKNNPTKPARN